MTPEESRAAHRRMIDKHGEQVFIRRYDGTGTSRARFEAEVQARIVAYDPEQLVGAVQEGDQKLIVMVEDLEAHQFPFPVRKDDKAIVRGKHLNIEAADDNTRRIAGELIALELRVRG